MPEGGAPEIDHGIESSRASGHKSLALEDNYYSALSLF